MRDGRVVFLVKKEHHLRAFEWSGELAAREVADTRGLDERGPVGDGRSSTRVAGQWSGVASDPDP